MGGGDGLRGRGAVGGSGGPPPRPAPAGRVVRNTGLERPAIAIQRRRGHGREPWPRRRRRHAPAARAPPPVGRSPPLLGVSHVALNSPVARHGCRVGPPFPLILPRCCLAGRSQQSNYGGEWGVVGEWGWGPTWGRRGKGGPRIRGRVQVTSVPGRGWGAATGGGPAAAGPPHGPGRRSRPMWRSPRAAAEPPPEGRGAAGTTGPVRGLLQFASGRCVPGAGAGAPPGVARSWSCRAAASHPAARRHVPGLHRETVTQRLLQRGAMWRRAERSRHPLHCRPVVYRVRPAVGGWR